MPADSSEGRVVLSRRSISMLTLTDRSTGWTLPHGVVQYDDITP